MATKKHSSPGVRVRIRAQILFLLVVMSLILSTSVPAAQIHIGFPISTLDNPFFVEVQRGAEDAGKELGVKVTVLSSEHDPAKQINQIDDFVVQKVDAICIIAVDSDAAVPAVESAIKQGVPVIAVDNGVNTDKVVSFIASDNVLAGKLAAKRIIEKIGKKGKVVELQGMLGAQATRERGGGFHEFMKDYPNIKIISQTANFNRTEGLSVMENLLAGNPDIRAVYAHNDEMALGASEAIRAARLKNIVVVGVDATDDARNAIKKGLMDASVAQQPYLMGKIAIETAVAHLKGKKVDSYIPVEVFLVTKENVDKK